MLMTIVQSVTSVSVQTKTATAVLTATVLPTSSGVLAPGTQNKKKSSGLSGGAIAGIVVGVVCGTIIFLLILLWYCGIGLLCFSGRQKDDEKSIRDDDSVNPLNDDHMIGFGRTPTYLYNADELSIGVGNRRFSQGSLPDAAAGSDSSNSNSGRGGLRVINPDLHD